MQGSNARLRMRHEISAAGPECDPRASVLMLAVSRAVCADSSIDMRHFGGASPGDRSQSFI